MKNNVNTNRSFRFVHIPKTGGTTFNKILFKQYPNHERNDFGDDGGVVLDKSKVFDNKQLFHGHSNLDMNNQYVLQTKTVIFFRDPVDRVISFIQHKFKEDKKFFSKEPKNQNINEIDLKLKFMKHCLKNFKLDVSNLQVKMLINNDKCNSDDKLNELENNNKDPVELAYRNLLEKTTSFGLKEYYDESIVLFKLLFNWEKPYYEFCRGCLEENLINENVRNKYGGTLDKIKEYTVIYNNLLKQISSQNMYDKALYKKLKKKFTKNIERADGFKSEFSSFLKQQEIYKKKMNFKQNVKQFLLKCSVLKSKKLYLIIGLMVL